MVYQDERSLEGRGSFGLLINQAIGLAEKYTSNDLLKGLITRADFAKLVTGKTKEAIYALCGKPDKAEECCTTDLWVYSIGSKSKHPWKTYHAKKTDTDYEVIIAFPFMPSNKAFLSFFAYGYIFNFGSIFFNKSYSLNTWMSLYPPQEARSRWWSLVIDIDG